MIGHQIFNVLQNFVGHLKPNFKLGEIKICLVDLEVQIRKFFEIKIVIIFFKYPSI